MKEIMKKKKKMMMPEKMMGEHKGGSLKSSSGQKVNSKKQAVAIGLSEARKIKK